MGARKEELPSDQGVSLREWPRFHCSPERTNKSVKEVQPKFPTSWLNAIIIEPVSLWPRYIGRVQWWGHSPQMWEIQVQPLLWIKQSKTQTGVSYKCPTIGLSASLGEGYFTLALSCVLNNYSTLELWNLPKQLHPNYLIAQNDSNQLRWQDLCWDCASWCFQQKKVDTYGRLLDNGNAVQSPKLHRCRFSK